MGSADSVERLDQPALGRSPARMYSGWRCKYHDESGHDCDHLAMQDLSLCTGLLALELVPEGRPSGLSLPVESAHLLGDAITADLGRLLPGVEAMGLAVAAALYDPAQLMRPGWPLFAELARLYARTQQGAWTASVSCFGASAGRMADPALEPDASLIGSSLLLIPWVLVGADHDAARINAEMEENFSEKGLAEARTSLLLNEAFSIRVEHARYLTRLDLCAMTGMQYENAGLVELWSLIECALLSPQQTESVTTASGGRYRWQDGTVHQQSSGDPIEQRQFAAVLTAHGISIKGN